jgi:hypothetical protein
VKVAESNQIVDAMNANNLPVTYIVFPDEGHGFHKPENNMAFNAATEAFLAEHIGGQFEPMGTSIADSTAQVRDKGGLDFGSVPTYAAASGEDDTPAILQMSVTIDDLTPEQRTQFEDFKTQIAQAPPGQLPMILNMIISQSGQAPESDKALAAMLAQYLDGQIKTGTATADVPTTP